MPAYVVIQLTGNTRARAFMARDDVRRLVARHDAQVLDATAHDNPLVPLTVVVADIEPANAFAAALRKLEGVETAYAKPGEALP